MKGLSEKVYLIPALPVEDMPVSDQQRLREALAAEGYADAAFSLTALRQMYPLCRMPEGVTLTLVCRDTGWLVTAVEAGNTTAKHYALAVDYGSTTIVMQLVDMNTGAVAAQVREWNGQSVYGTDILTRITYTMEKPEHARNLRLATVATFDRLLARLREETGVDTASCPVMVVSGNTAMIHFLLELDGWTVFAAPYAPVAADPGWLSGRELGMDFAGQVFFVPAASNYVGGDIVSGLLKLDIHRQEEPSLFFDIGTNGELVVGCRHWMMAGAGAAGPALEGYISRYGMRAAPGAVDTVRIRAGEMTVTTINGEKPIGICGSGIIDLLAQMRLNGWINIAGELQPEAAERIVYLAEEQQYAVIYAPGENTPDGLPRFFTQTDIRQYLETKAAACTMIDCLLDTAGCPPEALERCYLSGAFTAHSDLEAAVTIGLFPDIPRERYVRIANTSLEGARILLLDRERVEESRRLAESIYCVQFASIPDFIIRMRAARFIPHTDMERYPSVQRKLTEAGQ